MTITANNTAGLFNPLTRPNSNGNNPRLSGKVDERLNKYFDTSVYTQPAAFTFGNVGPTVAIRNGLDEGCPTMDERPPLDLPQ